MNHNCVGKTSSTFLFPLHHTQSENPIFFKHRHIWQNCFNHWQKNNLNSFWQITKADSLSQQGNVQTVCFLLVKHRLHIFIKNIFESSFSASKKREAFTQNPVNLEGQDFTFLCCIINSTLGTTWWHIMYFRCYQWDFHFTDFSWNLINICLDLCLVSLIFYIYLIDMFIFVEILGKL